MISKVSELLHICNKLIESVALIPSVVLKVDGEVTHSRISLLLHQEEGVEDCQSAHFAVNWSLVK